MMRFAFKRIENIVDKGENAGGKQKSPQVLKFNNFPS